MSRIVQHICLHVWRRELVEDARPWEFWTLIGSVRILPTSSLRSSVLIHSTRPSDVTQKSNGSASLLPSTGKCVDSLLPTGNPGDWARDTVTPRLLVDPGRPTGRGSTESRCTESVKSIDNTVFILFSRGCLINVITTTHTCFVLFYIILNCKFGQGVWMSDKCAFWGGRLFSI